MSRSFQNKFLTGSTSLTAYEQGVARDNIDAGFLNGFRNKIINGDFEIWQRGTSFVSPGGQPTADRWRVGGGGAGATYSVARINRNIQDDGTTHLMHLNQTAGAASIYAFQRIEGVRTLAGRKVTVTLWAQNAQNNPNIGVRLDQNFGVGGSATVTTTRQDATIVGTSYQRFDFVFDIPSITGKTIGADSFLELYIFNSSGGANTYPSNLYIGRVSIVEGDARAEADPFSPRHIQQELALCQRYYQYILCGQRMTFAPGFVFGNSGWSQYYLQLSVPMRATPTIADGTTIESASDCNATIALLVEALNNQTLRVGIIRPGAAPSSGTYAYIQKWVNVGAEL